jgi:hypothetical protein
MIKLFSCSIAFLISSFSFGFQLRQFSDYSEHRKQFDSVIAELTQFNVDAENWTNAADPQISTKAVLLKNKFKKMNRVLVISSGIHGVEAFVGSSIQIEFIRSLLKDTSNAKMDFAFLHILNPWGMTNNRRVNSENVDLNRNFVSERSGFGRINSEYEKVNLFLNPKSPLKLGFAHRLLFILDSIYFIFKYSMESLRRAILVGQYHLPMGLYYGGERYSELKSSIDVFFENKLKNYQEIIWIDLHTGYGENGKLHLLANDSNDQNSENLKMLLPEESIDFGQNNKFYKTTGDLMSYLNHKITKQKLTAVVFEYGTMDSQKALGSIESLRRMVIENQSYFNNHESEDRRAAVKLMMEMYNPTNIEWWNSIQAQTQKLFEKILKN